MYAARDIEKHTMVIEYIGEVIRHELSEIREKQYEARVRLIMIIIEIACIFCLNSVDLVFCRLF